jgi:hypothetical protein
MNADKTMKKKKAGYVYEPSYPFFHEGLQEEQVKGKR